MDFITVEWSTIGWCVLAYLVITGLRQAIHPIESEEIREMEKNTEFFRKLSRGEYPKDEEKFREWVRDNE